MRIMEFKQIKKLNMKKILSGLGIALMLMITMTGCSEPDASAQLTDGIWNFSNITTDSEDELIIALIAFNKEAGAGSTLEFQEGGDYIQDSPELEETITGTWSLIGDDQLILTPDTEDFIQSTLNINELSKDKLKYTFADPGLNNESVNITVTWTRN
jgi:hypothetical protein